MRRHDLNRKNAFSLSVELLAGPKYDPLLKAGRAPVLPRKLTEIQRMLGELDQHQQQQESASTGHTAQKDVEESELELSAHVLATRLRSFHGDILKAPLPGEYDLPRSGWQTLRDQQLLARTQGLLDLAAQVIATADPKAVEDYSLVRLSGDLKKERTDYADLVNAPAAIIAFRKVLSQSLPAALNLLSARLDEIGEFLLDFRDTPAGREMIAAFTAARDIKNLGHRIEEKEESVPTTGSETSPESAPAPST